MSILRLAVELYVPTYCIRNRTLLQRGTSKEFYKFVSRRISIRNGIDSIAGRNGKMITDDYEQACTFNTYLPVLVGKTIIFPHQSLSIIVIVLLILSISENVVF